MKERLKTQSWPALRIHQTVGYAENRQEEVTSLRFDSVDLPLLRSQP
jgi:hypothetical protein